MRVLVGIEDSKSTQGTLQALIDQFDAKKTEVRLLHVVSPVTSTAPPAMAPGYAPELEGQIKEGREFAEKAGGTLRKAGFTVDIAVMQGDVRAAIIDAAEDWKAEMIVIGSHGRKGFQRFLLGSVAESIARHAPCSVEIVRDPIKR